MKKFLSLFVVLAGFAVFAGVAFAAPPATVEYYTAQGNRVYGSDLYQTKEGWVYFGRNCYYFDRYGNQVRANGRRVFHYDIYGDFIAMRIPVNSHYDAYGNLIKNQ